MFVKQIVGAASLLVALAAATPTKRCFGPVVAIYARGTDPNMGTATQNDPDPTDVRIREMFDSGNVADYRTSLS